MDVKDFAEELFDYAGEQNRQGGNIEASVMYELGYCLKVAEDLGERVKENLMRLSLCRIALKVATRTKKQLPESIHARMVLGDSNESTRDYAKLLEKLKKSSPAR